MYFRYTSTSCVRALEAGMAAHNLDELVRTDAVGVPRVQLRLERVGLGAKIDPLLLIAIGHLIESGFVDFSERLVLIEAFVDTLDLRKPPLTFGNLLFVRLCRLALLYSGGFPDALDELLLMLTDIAARRPYRGEDNAPRLFRADVVRRAFGKDVLKLTVCPQYSSLRSMWATVLSIHVYGWSRS